MVSSCRRTLSRNSFYNLYDVSYKSYDILNNLNYTIYFLFCPQHTISFLTTTYRKVAFNKGAHFRRIFWKYFKDNCVRIFPWGFRRFAICYTQRLAHLLKSHGKIQTVIFPKDSPDVRALKRPPYPFT